ncbi:MAG: ribonuclease III [Candidatus Pelagadaptatus aseana]|uniref:ribonuclease III n=1 Tax=Candidatus Pelagadaptatus aseana TaxID=3120508 RepID=UPI0039B2AC88
MNKITLQRLLSRIGYEFSDTSLLTLALTHRSCGARNNERLEFLGDSILNFVIGEALFEKFPQAKEGQLSRLRSQLVKGETLAEVAREFELGQCLILGEGEMKSGGHRRDSILADAVEAIIGAIHRDSGFDAARERVLNWFASRLQNIQLELKKDPKTELQELLQGRKKSLPQYKVIDVHGEAHSQEFTVECRIELLPEPVSARASNRRTAEKMAAAVALEQLQTISK